MKYWAEKEGMEKGIKEGEKESRRKIAINMLKQNMEEDLICDLTELSQEEVRELKELIKKQ